MRYPKGNSPHPKRGSRRPIRPTPKVSYYCTFIEPTPKVRNYGRVGTTSGLIAKGRGFNFLQSRAGRPPNSPHSIHSRPTPNAIAHTNVQSGIQQSPAGQLGGNWFLTDSILRTGRIQSNQKNQSSYSRSPLRIGAGNQLPLQIT